MKMVFDDGEMRLATMADYIKQSMGEVLTGLFDIKCLEVYEKEGMEGLRAFVDSKNISTSDKQLEKALKAIQDTYKNFETALEMLSITKEELETMMKIHTRWGVEG